MPTISGSLNLVTDRPVDSISEVWVRARETRGQGDGLTVGVNDRVLVSDGALSFTALPGAAVLVLVQNGIPVETLPMLVGDEAQQSLRLVVQAGQVAGSADKSVIEKLAAEIAASITLAKQYHAEAVESASQAKASQSAASKSASNAKTSETKAKTSETNAKTSETNAASSAASAESQQKSAWTHFNNTVAEAGKAAGSAAAAKTSETNAASSASASASSASSASTQAGKSATSATQAGAARDAAKAHETAAAGSASEAKTSETNAAQSASNAYGHRVEAGNHARAAAADATSAASARDAAKQSQTAAKTSETNANTHRQAAATSASNAAASETSAGESATAAAGSATEAKGHAERAEQMADPTGLRNEVMQQLANLVDGAPEDLDTIREVAEYAQANRGITDQLNAAIGGKADKSHTHAWSAITGKPSIPVTESGYRQREAGDLPTSYPAGVSVAMNAGEQGWTEALKAGDSNYVYSSFVVVLTIRNGSYTQSAYQMVFSYTSVTRPVYIRKYDGTDAGWSTFRKLSDDGHTHTSADISDLPKISTVHSDSLSIVQRTSTGNIDVPATPVGNRDAASKGYVDGEVAKKANTSHTHTTAQVTGLDSALAGKANSTHTHTQAQVSGLSTALNNKADKTHSHTTAEITDFTTEMSKKANTSHTHTTSQISGLGTALNGKADKSQVDEVSGRVSSLEDSAPIIVSSLPADPLPGRIYLVTE